MRNGRWLSMAVLMGTLSLGCGGSTSDDPNPPVPDTSIPDVVDDTGPLTDVVTDTTPVDGAVTDSVLTDTDGADIPPDTEPTDVPPDTEPTDVPPDTADDVEPPVEDVTPSDALSDDVPDSDDTAPPGDTTPPDDDTVDVPPTPDVPVVDDTTDDAVTPTACELHQTCLDSDFCTRDLCTDGSCLSEAALCDDGDPCTNDACDSAVGCVHTPSVGGADCVVLTNMVFEALFDDGTTDGFTVMDLAPPPGEDQTAAVWTPDPLNTHSGAGALYMGIPGVYNYDTGTVVQTDAWSEPIAVPTGGMSELRVAAYLDVEPEKDWDVLSIMVAVDGANIPVWTKSSSNIVQKQWQVITVNLSAFAGKTIQVGLRFDSVEHTYNDTLGVVVDTVRVAQSGTLPTCTSDSDCDDGLACTTETCEQSSCVYALGSCCQSNSDCNDGDACTADLCGSDNACQFIPVSTPFCCNTTADCEDGNACTTQVCTGDVCQHTVVAEAGCCTSDSECADNDACTIDSCNDYNCQTVNICCQSDAECDDGDDVCTIDTCENGECKFANKNAPGCCSPTLFEATFDDGSMEGWTLANNSSVCKWSILAGTSNSPPNALFFGNAVTQKVDCFTPVGSGKATTPPIVLPDKVGLKVEFQVHLPPTLGTGPFVNLGTSLTVTLIPETGTKVSLYNSLLTSSTIWSVVTKSLDQWKGKTVQIEFSAVAPPFLPGLNSASGPIYVDDVQVIQPCESAGP